MFDLAQGYIIRWATYSEGGCQGRCLVDVRQQNESMAEILI
jgi:hypothetical protein